MEMLDFLFPSADGEDDPELLASSSLTVGDSSHIVVTTLSGECLTLPYNPNQTIQNIKNKIEEDLKTPCNKQCLLYQDNELKVWFCVARVWCRCAFTLVLTGEKDPTDFRTFGFISEFYFLDFSSVHIRYLLIFSIASSMCRLNYA